MKYHIVYLIALLRTRSFRIAKCTENLLHMGDYKKALGKPDGMDTFKIAFSFAKYWVTSSSEQRHDPL